MFEDYQTMNMLMCMLQTYILQNFQFGLIPFFFKNKSYKPIICSEQGEN